MKRLFLLLALIFICSFSAHAQTQITGFAADPPTCDNTRGLLYWNTVSLVFKNCGPTVNTWTVFAAAGGSPGAPSGSFQYNLGGVLTGEASVLDAAAFSGADWGAKLAACIAALPAAGGTCDGRGLAPGSTSTNPFASYTVPIVVWLGTGKYTSTVNWVLNTVTVNSNLTTPTIHVIGSGNGICGDTFGVLCALTGTTLDFTAASGIAHIDAQGYGMFEIDHAIIQDDSGGTVPFLQTTCTTLMVHDNSFLGSVGGSFSGPNQDAILLGTLGTNLTPCTDTGSAFQGYGTQITRNFFGRLRRWVQAGNFANDLVITGNFSTAGTNAGGFLNGAAIDFSTSNSASGYNISDNIIESPFYSYGVSLGHNGGVLSNDGIWDSTMYNVTAASCVASVITLTLSGPNIAAVGQKVSVVATLPVGYNATNVTLTAVNASGPSTVSYAGACPGAYVSGGVVNLTPAGILSQNGTNIIQNVVGMGTTTSVPYFDSGTPQSSFWSPAGPSYMASNVARLGIGLSKLNTAFDVVNPIGFSVGTANSYAAGITGDPNGGFDRLAFGTDGNDAYIQSFAGALRLNIAGQRLDLGANASASVAGLLSGTNTVAVGTSNFTTASTALTNITGLSWTFPAGAKNYPIHCHLSYSQATGAAANSFGFAFSASPLNAYFSMIAYTGLAAAPTNATVPTSATNVSVPIGTFTPSTFGAIGTVANIFPVELWGYAEVSAGTTLNIQVATGNASDSITIYRGSYCSIAP